MNVVIWARVSSREQREGYSLDAQLRMNRERAKMNGWRVLREFQVAESAKRGADRIVFNEMYDWVKTHARREKIGGLLSHKLDRVCRNMRDAVRMQELEDACGVKLLFVDNQFGPGAAGAFSFNVMAAVAQYYSDNLRGEVLKGMDEKVRQGWPTGHAPYGYINVEDRNEPVQPHPEQSHTLVRIFQLYASGGYTFKSLADELERGGHVFRPNQRRFGRTALSWILNNRFYIGELRRNGQVFDGRYKRLIDRATFDACHVVMNGRNRRTGNPELPLSGGLFQCGICGRAITGELIRRKLKEGGVREHVYYRCAAHHRDPNHAPVRWTADNLEQAIVSDLNGMRIGCPGVAAWFRKELQAAVTDLSTSQRRQSATLAKRRSELAAMQDRLLNAYLTGTVEECAYKTKVVELKAEVAKTDETLANLRAVRGTCAETAVLLFDFAQRAGEIWRGSNDGVRREILDAVCLNRALGHLTLDLVKRKPFDILSKRLDLKDSRGDRI
jgi:DNA invertase Pin-like site-specific DNA recombinase